MNNSRRSGVFLFLGIALLAGALATHLIFLDPGVWTWLTLAAGLVLTVYGGYAIRTELAQLARHRRGEIALYTAGMIGILVAVGWLSTRFPLRYDMTAQGMYSLSDATVKMLDRL